MVKYLQGSTDSKPLDQDLIALPTRLGGFGITLYAETASLGIRMRFRSKQGYLMYQVAPFSQPSLLPFARANFPKIHGRHDCIPRAEGQSPIAIDATMITSVTVVQKSLYNGNCNMVNIGQELHIAIFARSTSNELSCHSIADIFHLRS